MDLEKTIRELHDERRRLDEMIASLEAFAVARGGGAPKKRRGRKSMDEAERQIVSERMRKYWESRRSAPAEE